MAVENFTVNIQRHYVDVYTNNEFSWYVFRIFKVENDSQIPSWFPFYRCLGIEYSV